MCSHLPFPLPEANNIDVIAWTVAAIRQCQSFYHSILDKCQALVGRVQTHETVPTPITSYLSIYSNDASIVMRPECGGTAVGMRGSLWTPSAALYKLLADHQILPNSQTLDLVQIKHHDYH